VHSLYNAGNHEGAKRASTIAKYCGAWAIVVGAVIMGFSIGVTVLLITVH
jgi:hypothetical protein